LRRHAAKPGRNGLNRQHILNLVLLKDIPERSFDYEWYLSFETGAARTAFGLAVQLGSLLLATQRFRWSLIVDRDAYIDENEPMEFQSKEALVGHIRRALARYREYRADLQQSGILDENGHLVLPLQQ
jgi:hypothetical protein